MHGRLQTTLLACALALAAVGCGSGDEGTIPPTEGERLVQRLDAIESALASQDCSVVTAQAEDFKQEVAALPAEVDDEVKAGLIEGAERLLALSQEPDQCEDVTGPSGEAGVDTTTDTGESVTTSTTSTTATTEPEEEEESPEEEGGDEGHDPEGTGPPADVPGQGDPGGGRSGESDSGGLTGEKEGQG